MKFAGVILLNLSLIFGVWAQNSGRNPTFKHSSAPVSLATLEKTARSKTKATARLPLLESASVISKNADALESGKAPNYIRVLAAHTKAAPQFANLVQAVLYGGTVRPEIKAAMALKIAQIYDSPYLYAHAQRWLKASERGQACLKALSDNKPVSDAQQVALVYAELLTRDIHGVSDADFARTRAVYNDSQIVELTITVSFFNYFTRLVEALNLPVETWIWDAPAVTPAQFANFITPPARVALISDDEMAATGKAQETAKAAQTPAQGLGLGIANSQRAMLRVPEIAQTWRDFGLQRATWTIERNIQLQISLAVSTVNGCRYCTLHQVLGLRRLGVDPAKLLALKKDDAALTPRELNAVEFARKLTTAPASISNADFTRLQMEFGASGALEVVLQTGTFAFMNRFTDGLRLPSEDEAVRVYQETYGGGWKP